MFIYVHNMGMKKTSLKKRMGRPPVDNPRDKRLPVVQITEDQLIIYKAASERTGQTFSAWVRSALDKAAKRQ
jgi:hypothetical protein